jgi:hypothetical protein
MRNLDSMPRKQVAAKRRTALTLPSDSESAKHRRKEILDAYRKAFTGFSDDELAILDGVILEPAKPAEGGVSHELARSRGC